MQNVEKLTAGKGQLLQQGDTLKAGLQFMESRLVTSEKEKIEMGQKLQAET